MSGGSRNCSWDVMYAKNEKKRKKKRKKEKWLLIDKAELIFSCYNESNEIFKFLLRF